MNKAARIPLLALSVLCFSAFGGGIVNHLTQADLQAALAGGGTVLFGTGGTLTLTNMIIISLDTILDANGNTVTISGGNAVRLFQVTSNVSFSVKGLVLADGRVIGANGANGDPPGPGQIAFGAGILNQGGRVALTSCTLTNHLVQGGNAGQNLSNSLNTSKGGDGLGAAIYSLGGALNLTNCLVTTNVSTGGLGSSGSVPGYVPGSSGSAVGGAIFSHSCAVTLQSVTLTNNAAAGGVSVANINDGNAGLGAGGALYATNSTILVNSSSFIGNAARGGGAGSLQTTTGLSGDASGGAMFLSLNSTGNIEACVFQSNVAAGGPGAHLQPGGLGLGGQIFNAGRLQISDSTLSAGQSVGGATSPGRGGAVYSTGALIVNASAFFTHSAIGGDSVFTIGTSRPGAPGEGGAIWSSGLLNVTNSTFYANGALGGNGNTFYVIAGGSASGGAISMVGGTITLVNVTVDANSATGGVGKSPPSFVITNAPSQGGGLSNTNGIVTVRNSIIANSTNGGDVWGVVTDAGYNICSDGTANFFAAGSLNQADPLLSALSDNGGPTPTMSLLAGSPARDAIPSSFPPTDQRGVSRPQGPAADIGAVEADFISAAPAIVTQPVGETVRAGTNVTLTVGASGTAPLSYQWSKDGHVLDGATSSALSLLDVQVAQGGTYSVLVTNAYGSADSQGATLVVDSTPLILVQPSSVLVSPGAATNFSVVADGPSLSYQWWQDNVSIPEGTGPTLTIGSALAGAQGDYFVVVSNFAGMATSTVATLSFDASALSILVPPKDATVEAGYPVSFSVLATGIPPFAYQWELNGKPIPGATSSAYTIGSATTNYAGNYDAVVTNGYRSVVSSEALLTITPGAVPPVLVPARFGQSLTITFTAQAGRTYRLLSSTNLTTWFPAATNTPISAGPVQFVEPINAGPPAFYRVVTP